MLSLITLQLAVMQQIWGKNKQLHQLKDGAFLKIVYSIPKVSVAVAKISYLYATMMQQSTDSDKAIYVLNLLSVLAKLIPTA